MECLSYYSPMHTASTCGELQGLISWLLIYDETTTFPLRGLLNSQSISHWPCFLASMIYH